ncbi:hypothetical protein EDC01DRAFT_733109 [Geopyxis carbonaria]|nr:hypothetical protein EDC01DRAFT_733109 [Geopyxis carbonaria]
MNSTSIRTLKLGWPANELHGVRSTLVGHKNEETTRLAFHTPESQLVTTRLSSELQTAPCFVLRRYKTRETLLAFANTCFQHTDTAFIGRTALREYPHATLHCKQPYLSRLSQRRVPLYDQQGSTPARSPRRRHTAHTSPFRLWNRSGIATSPPDGSAPLVRAHDDATTPASPHSSPPAIPVHGLASTSSSSMASFLGFGRTASKLKKARQQQQPPPPPDRDSLSSFDDGAVVGPRRASHSQSTPTKTTETLNGAGTATSTSTPSRRISVSRKPPPAADAPAAPPRAHSHPTLSPDLQKSRLQAEYDRLDAASKAHEERARALAAANADLADQLARVQAAHTALQHKSARYKAQLLELRHAPAREDEDVAVEAYTALFESIATNVGWIAALPDAHSRPVEAREWATLLHGLAGDDAGPRLCALLDPQVHLRAHAPAFARAFVATVLVVRLFPTGRSSHRDVIKDLWTHESTADSFAELEDDLRACLGTERFNAWRATTVRYLQADARNDRTRVAALCAEVAQTLRVVFGLPHAAPSAERVDKIVRSLVLEAVAACKLLRRQKASFVVSLAPPRVPDADATAAPGPGRLVGRGSWKPRERERKGKTQGQGEVRQESVDFCVRPRLVRQTDVDGKRDEEKVCVETEMVGVVVKNLGGGKTRRETF